MEIFETITGLKRNLFDHRKNGKSIGFVPTMGALHKGHISLIDESLADNEITVCSIFVNPTQFNNPEDLLRYPKILEEDLKLLTEAGCDLVFVPKAEEIYPEPDNRVFDFGNLDKVMEGKYRPGHFNGVAQVVSRLFEIVKPDKAYFGEKDFQQLAIIKALVKQLNRPVEIIPCPIIREADGLAMSSRNKLLSSGLRKSASHISKTLFEALKRTNMQLNDLIQWVINEVNSDSNLRVEYFEVVDFYNLQPLSSWEDSEQPVGCIAVFAGDVRLIDNIRFF